MTFAIQLAIGFVVSLGLTPLARRLAFRVGCVAKPKQDRWHRKITPMFGGVAIVVTTILVTAVSGLPADLWLLLGGGIAIFIVGVVDDILSLKPATKLIAQIALASAFVFFGYRLHWVASPAVDGLLTMFWIVGITNAFNLLDNMDGLCAGTAVIALLAMAFGGTNGGAETAFMAVLAGATLGFLVYNFNPASIFMGDSGSLFLGFSLAALTLKLPKEAAGLSNVLSTVAAPLLVLLIPIFDTTLVTFSRVFNGRPASRGGRDHTSHRLVAIGLPERTAVLVLWVLAALGGVIAWNLHRGYAGLSLVSLSLFLLSMTVFAAYLARVRVYDENDPSLIAGRLTPFIVDFMYKRRVAEVLLDVALVVLSYYTAYRLRFESEDLSAYYAENFRTSLPIVLGVQTVAFFIVGVYRGLWRYFGLMDAVTVGKGVLLGTGSAVMLILYLYRFENYSRAVFIIYAIVLLLVVSASRASFRLISEFARRRRTGVRLVIYGAGDGGALVARELLARDAPYRMLGFVDDDSERRHTSVLGYSVIGGYDRLVSLISADEVDEVVLSTKTLTEERLALLQQLCTEHAVTLSRLHFSLEHLVASA